MRRSEPDDQIDRTGTIRRPDADHTGGDAPGQAIDLDRCHGHPVATAGRCTDEHRPIDTATQAAPTDADQGRGGNAVKGST